MEPQGVRAICEALPGTTVDVKWDNNLCFCIGGKMYAILSIDPDRTRLSFKVPEELFEVLTAMPEIIPAPYLARHKWVCLEHLDALPAATLASNLETSYSLVFAKLPARTRRAISTVD